MDISSLWEALPLSSLGPFGVALLLCFLFTLIPGPMSAFLVQNTLRHGLRGGLFLSIGSTMGELLATFIASLPFLFGITAISNWLLVNADKASIGFGLLILILGALNLRPLKVKTNAYNSKPLHALWSALYVGLHPGNILAFATLVTLLQSRQQMHTGLDVVWLLLGVLVGGGTAWGLYLLACLKARAYMTPQLLQKVRYGVGILLMTIGGIVALRGIVLLLL